MIDRLNLIIREILTGLSVIRAFSAEKHEEERFEEANHRLMKTNLFVNRCMTFMMPLMMLIMNGISVLIVYVGAHHIDEGALQVGDMMAFIQYTMQIIMAFLMISMLSVMLPRASVSANRIVEVLNTEVSIRNPEQPKRPPEDRKGEVEFSHVSFSYPGAEEEVLHDITFTAKKGRDRGVYRKHGKRKEYAGQPDTKVFRCVRRCDPRGRSGYPRNGYQGSAQPSRLCAAEGNPVFRNDCIQSSLRSGGCVDGGAESGGGHCPGQ